MTITRDAAPPPQPVRPRALLPEAVFHGDPDPVALELTDRSGDVRPGCLFAAIPGTRLHGIDFISAAISAGAALLLVDRAIRDVSIPQCIVPNVRSAYARLCAAAFGEPSKTVSVAGVTGTNGKTTVTWLIRAMLRQSGRRCGLLGTVEYDDGDSSAPSALTTPDSKTFSQWLARMAALGTTHAAAELSSHALHQDRVAGTELSAAAVTNVTQDHFDYHKDFASYQGSKAKILELLKPDAVVALNHDNPGSRALRDRLPKSARLMAFSLKESVEVSAQIRAESLIGSQFRLMIRGDSILCETPLIGRHNIENCLAAAAVCTAFDVSLTEMAAAIRDFPGAPGRLERISGAQRFEVFVDYAHTDDALRRCLHSLRLVTPGRLICVFGAGGDRDRSKRPLLGRAAQLADLPIVTSDNPRSESPDRIAADIVDGFDAAGPQPVVELDRARAIRRAIQLAQPGDSVLIAGKGHEDEQIFRDRRIAFDDRREARQALLELLTGERVHRRIGA